MAAALLARPDVLPVLLIRLLRLMRRSKDGAAKSCGLTLELVTLAREAVSAKPAWVRLPHAPFAIARRRRVIVLAGDPQINAVEKSATWLWQVLLTA